MNWRVLALSGLLAVLSYGVGFMDGYKVSRRGLVCFPTPIDAVRVQVQR
jgi:hypothetical protein